MNGDGIIGVGALTAIISERLDDLGNLQVRGEISQGRVVASGHYYATLKDRDAVISLVCWRSTAARLGNRLPKEGDEVVVRGKLSVYGPRGQYQLVATGFRAVGAGDLAAQFEALKQKLSAERLFDPEHKRQLPYLPQGVGIATASGSAARGGHAGQHRCPLPRYAGDGDALSGAGPRPLPPLSKPCNSWMPTPMSKSSSLAAAAAVWKTFGPLMKSRCCAPLPPAPSR